MALTLKQAKELSQDKLTNEVIDEFRQSPLMDAMVFDNTIKPQGGSSLFYSYNKITTQPTADARKINNEYTAQETVTEAETTQLKVFGGAYEIDRVIANDEVQVVNHIAFQSQQKAKAAKAKFHDMFINGDASVNADEFTGIDKYIVDAKVHDKKVDIDLSSSALVKENAHELLYALRQLSKGTEGFTHILMNSDAYAVFLSASDVLPNIRYSRDEMGNEVYHYGNARIVDMGFKPGTNDEVIETKEDGTTSIYGVRIAQDGVHAVSPDGSDLVKIFYPDMEAPGAVKTGEVEMVSAVVVKNTNAAAKISGLKVVSVAAGE